jgi:hypothetical protein
MRFLVDHCGEIANISPTRRYVSPRAAGASAASLSCSGQVEWHERHGTIALKFRPSFVTASAHSRILSWLDSGTRRRVHFAYWAENNWHHEILSAGAVAVKRFQALVSQYGGGDYGQAIRRMKSPADIGRHRAFKEAISLWAHCGQDFSLHDHLPLFQNLMKGRATLLRAAPDGDFYLESPGQMLSIATRNWAARNSGIPVSNIPYYRCTQSLFDGFVETRQTRMPMADELDVFFTWPGLMPKRISYHRVVLPLRGMGADWVLSTTILDDDVDLLP